MATDAGTATFADAYLRARMLEGRLYPDSIVAALPDVPAGHPLAAEWRLRADSAARLLAYLRSLPGRLTIVDVGCGNGWLANELAAIDGATVVGLDANEVELRQAERVFGSRPNLRFVVGDATSAPCPVDEPTIVVVSSAIQYVADLPAAIERLLGWLAPGGELHILDSPIYDPSAVPAAALRTSRHYESLGVPEMAPLYRHHTWPELRGFDCEILYRPDALTVRVERRLLGRARSPFPWLRFRPASGARAASGARVP